VGGLAGDAGWMSVNELSGRMSCIESLAWKSSEVQSTNTSRTRRAAIDKKHIYVSKRHFTMGVLGSAVRLLTKHLAPGDLVSARKAKFGGLYIRTTIMQSTDMQKGKRKTLSKPLPLDQKTKRHGTGTNLQ